MAVGVDWRGWDDPGVAEAELIGGPEKRGIFLAAYDPAWPGTFEGERRRIVVALGPLPHRLEHIGSTSVPGLAAKPIIDSQLSVPDVEDEDSYLPCLERVGYALRVRERGHRMVRSASLELHLHVCDVRSDWERRHLLLRDWLRRSPADRRLYEEAKRELAEREWPTMNDYAAAKSDVIGDIKGRAEVWAALTGWAC